MIARNVIILLVLIFTTANAVAQSAYVNTREGIFQLTGGPGSGQRVLISEGCGNEKDILSIAIHNDTVYYNTWSGALKRFKIGSPDRCETLITSGFADNSLTVDKNGMVYMATESLTRFNPYTKQLQGLGMLPFWSMGDMIFFKEKLLLAGWDPRDPSKKGIYEIDPENIQASKLYMSTPSFIGLLSFPVACGSNRYYGLYPTDVSNTDLVEIDLVSRKLTGSITSIPARILDAASSTESGSEGMVSIMAMSTLKPSNCGSDDGAITISASTLRLPLTYTLLNKGISNTTGHFQRLREGAYDIRIIDAAGCARDTSILVKADLNGGGCNQVLIPSAFSPNNDGKNDRFYISVPSGYKGISIQVFNRGGAKVFEGKGLQSSWDGRYLGTAQPVGVYVYVVHYTDHTGKANFNKGTVTIIL
ncbi:MAG: gliding motility-associated C-terminal domain-containing protein [Chitinophagaceae bacterium]|nr:gliding motility-associated C-terminal domain-containing protein [Chitinophagaceae bacterium]